jgi:basic membrane protein A
MSACAELVRSGCSLIIAPGHEAAGAVETYAKINPDINFVLIDHETKIPLANVKNIYFRVDEVCFPLGFLSAWWAHHKDNRSPRVGWIGGLNIPEIRRFTESYTAGVNYFSDKYDIDILLSQAYANSFSDPALGRQIANLMLESGTEIIFPVAGKTGIGAYEMIGTRHKWAVGVDFDMGRSDIWYSNIFLSSCVKNFEQAISTVAAASLEQNFDNEAYIGTLSNDGVKMAPYHGFETIIPDSIKQEIAQIKEKIINNEIFTGAE